MARRSSSKTGFSRRLWARWGSLYGEEIMAHFLTPNSLSTFGMVFHPPRSPSIMDELK